MSLFSQHIIAMKPILSTLCVIGLDLPLITEKVQLYIYIYMNTYIYMNICVYICLYY